MYMPCVDMDLNPSSHTLPNFFLIRMYLYACLILRTQMWTIAVKVNETVSRDESGSCWYDEYCSSGLVLNILRLLYFTVYKNLNISCG